jgi:hypothetical protein
MPHRKRKGTSNGSKGISFPRQRENNKRSGTRFVSIVTAAQGNRPQSEIAEIENEIADGGLQLDIQTPR